MDDVTRGTRDEAMPYGVDTIRLRIEWPAAPVSQGYNGRMWRMRPLRGWTGAARLDAQRAEGEAAAPPTLLTGGPDIVEAQHDQVSGENLVQNIQFAPGRILPVPWPPIAVPGTAENEDFIRSTEGLAKSAAQRLEEALQAIDKALHSQKVDEPPKPEASKKISPSGQATTPTGPEDSEDNDATQRRDQLAAVDRKITPKGASEADTIQQAEREGLLQGTPRRPDLKAGEPDHDFVVTDSSGKTVGYAEIKTPVNPSFRAITTQASDVAASILRYPKAENLQVIVDLKNLDAASKAQFLDALEAGGVSRNSVTLLNAME